MSGLSFKILMWSSWKALRPNDPEGVLTPQSRASPFIQLPFLYTFVYIEKPNPDLFAIDSPFNPIVPSSIKSFFLNSVAKQTVSVDVLPVNPSFFIFSQMIKKVAVVL